ncbi:MAG TPA: HNH endonuclease signature motif containing protein [Polyangia bacterium]|nr:HNH endonuclease signature motif containing protein [Polyangia bacterium]
MRRSAGTRWPLAESRAIEERDGWCVAPRLLFPGECAGSIERDHVRAGGMGMKSESSRTNGVLLCSYHHREKTENGRVWRPRLVAYLTQFYGEKA